jgi:NADPH:quinone reductase-like Zn-dependent oxidoreductase
MMKALVLHGIKEPLKLEEVSKPTLNAGEVLVKIKAAAFNRRDYWIQQGKYAGLKFPITLGSDGCGVLAEVYDDANQHWIGKEVVINPSFNWGDAPNYQGKDFKILGLPDDGTFAAYVKVPVVQVYEKPTYLNDVEAAAFPLAGLTAYRALFTKAQLKKNEKVLIVGIGGGAATFALLWAVYAGAEVYVTSGSDDKIAKAIKLGVKGGVNYKSESYDTDLQALAADGFDVIIDSAIGEGFAKHLNHVKPGARLVFFGATAGDLPPLNARIIFWKQLQIMGTTMGTAQEFEDMLQFMTKHKIKPVVESVFSYEDAEQAIRLMDQSDQFGKIVITFND